MNTNNIQEIIDKLTNGDIDVESMSKDEVQNIRGTLNPLSRAIKLDGAPKYYAYSLINLREEYLKKFLMTSLISFLYRMNDEHGVPEGDYVIHTEKLDKEKTIDNYIRENSSVVNGELRVEVKPEKKAGVSGGENFSQEESNANKLRRIFVKEFLDSMFEFNPDEHVRSAYHKNNADPERVPLDVKKKTGAEASSTSSASTEQEKQQREYDRAVEHIPPADVFNKFKCYTDSHYDALRFAVNDIYCEKPDLDYVLIVYNEFATKDEYNNFVHKHEDDLMTEIRCATQNQWTFQAAFRENREREQFYSKNTRVLQEMLENAEKNQKLGKDLLAKRIKKKKQQNVEECGKDSEAFTKNYRSSQASSLRAAGLRDLPEEERVKAELEKKYTSASDKPSALLDTEEYKNAIEVPVWTHNPHKKTMVPSSFFTESEKPDTSTSQLIGKQ